MAQEYEQAPKLQLVPGGTERSATFVLSDEDHTLGNALRYMLMRNKDTSFCGYSMPHPSEAVVNIRLQTMTKPATDVFRDALLQLVETAEHMGSVFDEALEKGPVTEEALLTADKNASVAMDESGGASSATTTSAATAAAKSSKKKSSK